MANHNLRFPTFYISHGGGPWTHMKEQNGGLYDRLEEALKDMPRQIGFRKPRAVLMVSGHWEEDEFVVQGNSKPPMLYDYGGFPAHTYKIQYNSPGDTNLAAQVKVYDACLFYYVWESRCMHTDMMDMHAFSNKLVKCIIYTFLAYFFYIFYIWVLETTGRCESSYTY